MCIIICVCNWCNIWLVSSYVVVSDGLVTRYFDTRWQLFHCVDVFYVKQRDRVCYFGSYICDIRRTIYHVHEQLSC
jgi:hypothetical protein